VVIFNNNKDRVTGRNKLNIKRISESVFNCVLSLLLLTQTLHIRAVQAQSPTTDFEIPTIVSSSLEETDQALILFKVEAIDNIAIAEISVYYRYSDSQSFQQIQLKHATDGLYSTQLKIQKSGELHHYVVATDTSGNKTQRGNSFFPEVTQLSSNALDKASTTPNYLYYILGVLAIGAVAGLAGGGGSSSEPETCCTVTINTTPQ